MDRSWRAAIVAAGTLLLLVAAPPGPSAAQDRCLPTGVPGADTPWAQHLLAAERVWPHATGAGQRVAVVSTGIDEHPQLTGVVAAQTDLAPAPQFGEPSGRRDCLGIGTGVAGVIAGAPTDRIGFHGTAPGARLLSAKVVGDQFPIDLEARDSVTPGVLARGIDWAVDRDASVIAVATVAYRDSESLRTAVARAHSAGIIVVASVGDLGSEDEPPGLQPFPASYDGVIGVAAIGPSTEASISRRGPVDLAAPGVELITTYPGGGYGPAHGTALATGYVAAAAALVRSYRPDLSEAEVRHRLLATATPAPEGVGSPSYGYGIVNPYHAVLDRVVAGEPAAPAAFVPVAADREKLAQQAAQERSDTLAAILAGAGLAMAAALTAAVRFGPGGRRRRWRTGLASPPPATADPSDAAPASLFETQRPRRPG